jgi:hypothetical protein
VAQRCRIPQAQEFRHAEKAAVIYAASGAICHAYQQQCLQDMQSLHTSILLLAGTHPVYALLREQRVGVRYEAYCEHPAAALLL